MKVGTNPICMPSTANSIVNENVCYSCTHTHTHIRTLIHARTHTHTHTHAYTLCSHSSPVDVTFICQRYINTHTHAHAHAHCSCSNAWPVQYVKILLICQHHKCMSILYLYVNVTYVFISTSYKCMTMLYLYVKVVYVFMSRDEVFRKNLKILCYPIRNWLYASLTYIYDIDIRI